MSEHLEHYGVLGMKWGHRKTKYKNSTKKRQTYHREDRYLDKQVHGARGVMRIEKRMKKGASHRKAVAIEYGRDAVKTFIAANVFDQIMFNGALRKHATVQAGKKIVDAYMKSKESKSIIKIAQNSKFNPIDVAYEIFDA